MEKSEVEQEGLKMKEIQMSRNGVIGSLKTVNVEICRKCKYIWVAKIALVDDEGKWLYTGYWNLNQINTKAIPELKNIGWEIISNLKQETKI